MGNGVFTVKEVIGKRLSDERARLESEAGLKTTSHFRRVGEKPFLAEQRPSTTILFGGLTWRHERFIKAIFDGCGYNCEILPNPDLQSFNLGKENCHTAQCNPSYFTVGSLIQFLQGKKREGLSNQEINDRYVLYTVGSCGPCRHGMYESEYRYALDNAGFEEFRVLLFQQSKDVMSQDEEPGLKYTADLGMGALNALILGDVVSDMIYQIRPYEVNPGETQRVFDECANHLADFLRDREPFEILEALPQWISVRLARKKPLKNPLNSLGKFREHFWGKAYVDALHECRERINRIEVDRTRAKPIVKITGEFFSQTSESPANYNMFAFLENEGAQVQTEPISSWITYLLYQARARWVSHKLVNAPHQRSGRWELRKRFANEMHFQKRHRLLKFADRMYSRLYRRATDGLGGLAHGLVSQEELARLAHSFYHTLARGGEAHLEVGKNIYYTKNKLCHMVLSLKPFGCMPSQLSDGVQSAVINRYRDMIFLPVETSGDGEVHAHSRVQMALSEAKLKVKKEFQQALESTGKDLDQIKDYISCHPQLTQPLSPVPHRPGYPSLAANFVLHVSDLMDGKTNGHRRD